MSEIEGFILTGGKSSRMGTNKARLMLGGQSFVRRIAAALSSISGQVRLVGGETEAETLAFVPDVHREWGALGGLHAALDACRSPWAAIVACDLPFVTGQLFRRLADFRENFEAVVPVQSDGRLQPLCALYRASACLSLSRELIAAGERRPRVLLEHARARRIAPCELADLSGADRFFTNVNTPEDYRQAKAIPCDE